MAALTLVGPLVVEKFRKKVQLLYPKAVAPGHLATFAIRNARPTKEIYDGALSWQTPQSGIADETCCRK